MRDGTQTRQQIDRAALRLFARKGIKETTIRDIAEAAGIAEGTLYRHYMEIVKRKTAPEEPVMAMARGGEAGAKRHPPGCGSVLWRQRK